MEAGWPPIGIKWLSVVGGSISSSGRCQRVGSDKEKNLLRYTCVDSKYHDNEAHVPVSNDIESNVAVLA